MEINHVAVPARGAEASARFLADILGLGAPHPDGPDGDMVNLSLGAADLLFVESVAVASHHIAFGVTQAEFAAIVSRMVERGIPFGNEPEHPDNGLGGSARRSRARLLRRSERSPVRGDRPALTAPGRRPTRRAG